MAAATVEQLQALRTEAEGGNTKLVTRLEALDQLVARIDQGFTRADDNDTALDVRATQSEQALKDANDTVRALNVQNVKIEVGQSMQGITRVESDTDARKGFVDGLNKDAGRKMNSIDHGPATALFALSK